MSAESDNDLRRFRLSHAVARTFVRSDKLVGLEVDQAILLDSFCENPQVVPPVWKEGVGPVQMFSFCSEALL